MFLSDLSIKQPVLATMLAVTLMVLGVFSYRRAQRGSDAERRDPGSDRQTVYPGASPETVEREVSKRIEEALNTIPGVRHISSTTTEGLSMVVVEFRLGVKIGTAQQDAQSKINAIRADFPKDMEEPVIQRIDFNAMPIVSVTVESQTADVKTLSSLAEKVLKKRLENVPGVGQVNLVGLARREVQVLVDREKLKAFGLTYAEVAGALQRENLDVPAGKLRAGRGRAAGARVGQVPLGGGVPEPDRGHAQRPADLPPGSGAGGGRHRGAPQRRADRRPPGLVMDIVKQSGREHGRGGRQRHRGGAPAQHGTAAAHPPAPGGGPLDLHPRLGRGREGDSGAGRPPDRADRLPLPE